MKKFKRLIALSLVLALVTVLCNQVPASAAIKRRQVKSFKAAVTAVTLDKTTMTLTAGGTTGTLTATVIPYYAKNKTVTWKTSNASVATVLNGTVTPLAAGTAVITATSTDGLKTASCTVTVNPAVVATQPTSPTEPTQPTTPVVPIQPTEPVVPTQPTSPVVPTQPTSPTTATSVKTFLCSDGQYVKGDGIHDDTTGIQKALNSGKPISFDPGVYKVTSTLHVQNNNIIDGNGATITVPSSTENKVVFNLTNKSNVTIKNLNIKSTADKIRKINRIGLGSNVYAIHVTATANDVSKNITLSNIYGENLEYLVKIDSASNFNKNIVMSDIKTYNCAQSIYMAQVDGVTMKNIDLDQATDVSKFDHHVYINGGSYNINIDNIIARRGSLDTYANAFNIASSSEGTYLENIKITNASVANLNNDSVFAFINVKNGTIDGFTGNLSSTCVFWYYKVNDITLNNFNVNGTITQYIDCGGSLPWTKDPIYNNLITLSNSTANIAMTSNLFLGENLVIKDNTFNIKSAISNNAFMRLQAGNTAKVIIENNSINIQSYPNNVEFFDIRCSNGADVFINNNTIINNSGTSLNFIFADYTTAGGTSKIVVTNNFYRGYKTFTLIKTLATVTNNNII
jgi:hypothetical protein